MIDVAMDVSVGNHSYQVQGPAVQGATEYLLPCLAFKYLSGCNGFTHQFGALREDSSGAKGVVPHLGISHIIVRGHPHGRAMCFQRRVQGAPCKVIQGRGVSEVYAVAVIPGADSHAVHDHRHDRTGKFRISG